MRPKNETAQVTVVLRKNRPNKFGAYPIIVKITKDRKKIIKSTGFDCTEMEWDEATQRPNKKHPKYLKLKKAIDEIVDKIEDFELECVRENRFYTVYDIQKRLNRNIEEVGVFEVFDRVEKQLNEDGKVGTAASYKKTKRMLELHRPDKKLAFRDINYAFLTEWESFCVQRGHRDTTLFFYFKTFRALIKRAIKLDLCPEGDYGYKNFSLSRYNLKTRKRAISLTGIKQIEQLDLEHYSAEWMARNYFLFSFYTRGTNLTDIAYLTKKNIIDGRLEYTRQKTGDLISLKLNDHARRIIAYYEDLVYDDYLFPVFDERHDTIFAQKERVRSLQSTTSKRLKSIAKKIGLQCNLTMYVARHSYASGLKANGVTTSAIKEALSHKDEKTTEIYLEELGNEKIDQFDEMLYNAVNSEKPVALTTA